MLSPRLRDSPFPDRQPFYVVQRVLRPPQKQNAQSGEDRNLDRHGEEVAVATFAESLKRAASEFLVEPRGLPLIPNWNRVLAAIPEFFEVLADAVERDGKEN